MAKFIYYQDGEEERRGPFDEKAVLELYNGAEFHSEVRFQIRKTEDDSIQPFTLLKELIWKNGAANPFSDELEELDKRIDEKEKELESLRAIASKKEDLERRVAEIEKKLAEKMKEKGAGNTKENVKPAQKAAPAQNDKLDGLMKKFPGLKVEAWSADNPKHALTYRQSLHRHFETSPLWMCTSCLMMLANWKQYLMHTLHSCPNHDARMNEQFGPDYPRWKKEDADRLAMGRRLYEGMDADARGSARPPTDFVEDINHSIKKDMKLDTDAGRTKTIAFLESDSAKKLNERFIKHLKASKGKLLVCKHCEVACKTHVHFIIHLTTYGHRIKVKNTSFELLSLLVGWFNRGAYLKEADESEYKEDVDPDPNWSLEMNSVVWTEEKMPQPPSAPAATPAAPPPPRPSSPPRDGEPKIAFSSPSQSQIHLSSIDMKAHLINQFASERILSCTACDAMYTNFRQFLVHLGSNQHEEVVARVKQSASGKKEDERDHEDFLKWFNDDLQKWRWDDRVKLSCGQRVYKEWSEEERTRAVPKESFVRGLSQKIGETVKKTKRGRYDEYFLVAEKFFTTKEAAEMMMRTYAHLNESQYLACVQCKFGCKEINPFLIHCMTYDHVRATQGTIYELPTILLGVHNKELYLS